MARFIGCEAINNRSHGFVVSGNSELTNCKAEGNGGEGFLDLSEGEAPPAKEPTRREKALRYLRDTSSATIAAVLGANSLIR